MAPRAAAAHDLVMEVIRARTTVRQPSRLSQIRGASIGIILLGLALALGYIALGTPYPERFLPQPRMPAALTVATALGWTLLLVAPTLAALAGIAWLVNVIERTARSRPEPPAIGGLAKSLGPEYFGATGVRLPDGRGVAELVVGPHGIVVIEPLLPASLTRNQGGRWELHVGRGRWVPLENPLDRVVRTADRVRHWLGTDDRDFVVKVYAALLIGDGARSPIERTAACAVITRQQLPAYLASLPIQRSFSTERRGQVLELIRGAV